MGLYAKSRAGSRWNRGKMSTVTFDAPVAVPVTFPFTLPVGLPVTLPVTLPVGLPVTLPVTLPAEWSGADKPSASFVRERLVPVEARGSDQQIEVHVSASTDPRSSRAGEATAARPLANGDMSQRASERANGAELDASGDRVSERDEVDELEDLGDQIATLSAHVNAATYRLLCMIAEFDRRGGWKPGGFRSCAHWLAARTKMDMGAAREKVRSARALEKLPLTSEAMEHGELSFAQVRAISRVAEEETEADLLEYARVSTAAQLERLVRSWRLHSRADETELERIRYRSRTFSVFSDDDGMYLVRGRLPAEVGALLMRAVEAASDALFPSGGDDVEPQQRRADALGLLAERALAAGFGEQSCGCGEEESEAEEKEAGEAEAEEKEAGKGPGAESTAAESTAAERAAAKRAAAKRTARHRPEHSLDVSAERFPGEDRAESASAPALCRCRPAPLSGTRAERYQVLIHVEPQTLRSGAVPGLSELEDGTRLAAETARRLTCDASLVRVTRGSDGSVLDVGRKTRTIPPALRRAMNVRDGGCRFPGCGSRFVEGHHIEHWEDGGATNLRNCLSTCAFHHRLVHEGGFHVRMLRGGARFFTPDWKLIPGHYTAPRLKGDPVAALVATNRGARIDPGPMSTAARYVRENDIPLPLMLRAAEAVAASGQR